MAGKKRAHLSTLTSTFNQINDMFEERMRTLTDKKAAAAGVGMSISTADMRPHHQKPPATMALTMPIATATTACARGMCEEVALKAATKALSHCKGSVDGNGRSVSEQLAYLQGSLSHH